MDEMIYHEIPLLNQPYLIAGFEGWPNAAEVSSFSLQHLVETLKAKSLLQFRWTIFIRCLPIVPPPSSKMED
jgi:hypothetical protein